MNAKADSRLFGNAFVASQLERVADLIVTQGEAILEDAGVEFPSRAVSAVLLIGERGQISAADIADALDQPHQLVTQRIELLIEAGVVDRVPDPEDGRRKILQLTDKGSLQFERLKLRLDEADKAFAALFKEIDCDLPAICRRTFDALSQSPLLKRIKAL